MSTTDDYDSDRKPGESFSTVSLHHGQTLDSDHRARAPPIYASTSFAFEDAAHGADVSQRRAVLFLAVSFQVPVAVQQRFFSLFFTPWLLVLTFLLHFFLHFFLFSRTFFFFFLFVSRFVFNLQKSCLPFAN